MPTGKKSAMQELDVGNAACLGILLGIAQHASREVHNVDQGTAAARASKSAPGWSGSWRCQAGACSIFTYTSKIKYSNHDIFYLMEWLPIRILGGFIAFLGLLSAFSNGFLSEMPPSALILACVGAFIYLMATKKQRESDIKEFYTRKGYSKEQAEERAKLTTKILRERNVWPNFGVDDLAQAAREVKSYLMKEIS
jgi:hypothetical protein